MSELEVGRIREIAEPVGSRRLPHLGRFTVCLVVGWLFEVLGVLAGVVLRRRTRRFRRCLISRREATSIQQHSLPPERIIDIRAGHFARLRANSGAARPVVVQSQVRKLLATVRGVHLATGVQTNPHVATEQLVSLEPMSTGHQPAAACGDAGIGQRLPGHSSPRSSDCADLRPRSTATMHGYLSLPDPATAPVWSSQTLTVANRLRAVLLTDRAGLGKAACVIASQAHYEAARAAQAATGARKMGTPFPPPLQPATTEMRGLGCCDRAVRDYGEVISRPSFDQEGLYC